jgi:hypothetical protein
LGLKTHHLATLSPTHTQRTHPPTHPPNPHPRNTPTEPTPTFHSHQKGFLCNFLKAKTWLKLEKKKRRKKDVHKFPFFEFIHEIYARVCPNILFEDIKSDLPEIITVVIKSFGSSSKGSDAIKVRRPDHF